MKLLTAIFSFLFFTITLSLSPLSHPSTASAQAPITVNTTVRFINKDGNVKPIRTNGIKTTLQYRDDVPGSVWKNAEIVNTRVEEYTENGVIVVTGMSTDVSRNLSRGYKLTIEIEKSIAFEPHNPPPFEFLIKPCDLEPAVNESTCPGSRLYAVRPSSNKGDHALVDNRGEWPEIQEQYITTPGGTTPVPTAPEGFNPTATIMTTADTAPPGASITFRVTTENYTPGGTSALIFVAQHNGSDVLCREITRSPEELTVTAPQTVGETLAGFVYVVTDQNRSFCNPALPRVSIAEKRIAVQTGAPLPPQGPTCPTDCIAVPKKNECGYEKPCSLEGIPAINTVLVTLCKCPDRELFVCKDIGPQPPECGALFPTPTPFPCPVCPDDHPRWDPPGDLNGRCCEKDGKPGECKSPVPKIRKDDCEPGIPCGFGIGCGLGTRGPCGKKLDEKGNPTDAFTCDTAIGTFDVTPQAFVKRLFGLLLGVSGGVALLLILYSSYRLMMSRGDPEKLQGARETLTSAIVGLIFIIFSLVILEIVGVDILRIPTLGR